jgi:hypothetical protein
VLTRTTLTDAQQDLRQLGRYLKLVFENDSGAAARLNQIDPDLRRGISEAIVHLLVASIAANHLITPADRGLLEKQTKVDGKANPKISGARRLFEQNSTRSIEALLTSIAREVAVENAVKQIGKFNQGAPHYRAFEKFVRIIALHCGKTLADVPFVKLTESSGSTERYDRRFAELLEAAFLHAENIWKKSALSGRLSAPSTQQARLDYALKVVKSHAQ